MLRTLLFIGMGSFIGGIARFLLARWVQGGTGSSFPFGTLAVNVLGCLAIGLLYGIFERGNLMNPDLRLFLTVGLWPAGSRRSPRSFTKTFRFSRTATSCILSSTRR